MTTYPTETDESSVLLASGELEVEIAPQMGGSVKSFRKQIGHSTVELMRPFSAAGGDHLASACAMFPMLPYANRIADNRFKYDGNFYDFEPNCAGQALNLHGTGWLSAWSIESAGPDEAKLCLDYSGKGGPYCYSAYQYLHLTPQVLRIEMGITNLGSRTMPFGMGLHPWYFRQPGTQLRFQARHFWLEGPNFLATDRITTPTELDFSRPRELPLNWRNNCYSGWNGLAEILYPKAGFGLRIEADPIYQHLMLYCDPSQSVFCLEPQTHAPGELNRLDGNAEDDQEMVCLRSEETMTGSVAFTPFQLG